MTSNPTFIQKLYSMLEDPANQLHITWTQAGDGFKVVSPSDFSKKVLPLCFKHSNFSSFVRQLNMYGFHKVNEQTFHAADDPQVLAERPWEFRHSHFKRGEFELLQQIKRKTPLTKQQQSQCQQYEPYEQHLQHYKQFVPVAAGRSIARGSDEITTNDVSKVEQENNISKPITLDGILQRLVALELCVTSHAINQDGNVAAQPSRFDTTSTSPSSTTTSSSSTIHNCPFVQKLMQDTERLAHTVARLSRHVSRTNEYLLRMAKDDDLSKVFLRKRKEDAESLLLASHDIMSEVRQVQSYNVFNGTSTIDKPPLPHVQLPMTLLQPPTQHGRLISSSSSSLLPSFRCQPVESGTRDLTPSTQPDIRPFPSVGNVVPLRKTISMGHPFNVDRTTPGNEFKFSDKFDTHYRYNGSNNSNTNSNNNNINTNSNNNNINNNNSGNNSTDLVQKSKQSDIMVSESNRLPSFTSSFSQTRLRSQPYPNLQPHPSRINMDSYRSRHRSMSSIPNKRTSTAVHTHTPSSLNTTYRPTRTSSHLETDSYLAHSVPNSPYRSSSRLHSFLSSSSLPLSHTVPHVHPSPPLSYNLASPSDVPPSALSTSTDSPSNYVTLSPCTGSSHRTLLLGQRQEPWSHVAGHMLSWLPAPHSTSPHPSTSLPSPVTISSITPPSIVETEVTVAYPNDLPNMYYRNRQPPQRNSSMQDSHVHTDSEIVLIHENTTHGHDGREEDDSMNVEKDLDHHLGVHKRLRIGSLAA